MPLRILEDEANLSERPCAAPSLNRAVFLKPPHHTCCQGVDMPGVGHVHAPECPVMARRAQLPETLADFVSDPPCRRVAQGIAQEVRELIAQIDASITGMKAQEKAWRKQWDSLVPELIFAARDLARHNLWRGSLREGSFGSPSSGPRWCLECQMAENLGVLAHTKTCRTGRVERVVADLIATLDSYPTGKEAAAEETGCAGDGIRPRGLTSMLCLKCGVRGGSDWTWEPCDGEVNLALLGLNQVSKKAGAGDQAIYTHHGIYTHHCKGGAMVAEDRTWIIQRCTQRVVGSELQYEDFRVPGQFEGLMTRSQMIEVLDRVSRAYPNDEFRGHNTRPVPGGAQ